MNGNMGALIRLIDIVLTLLFGFMVISDLDPHKRIDLPQTSRESQTASQEQRLFTITVSPDGTFQIKGPDDSSSKPLGSPDELEGYLISTVASDPHSVVVIAPKDDSTVQQSVVVLDLCLKHHIADAALDLGS